MVRWVLKVSSKVRCLKVSFKVQFWRLFFFEAFPFIPLLRYLLPINLLATNSNVLLLLYLVTYLISYAFHLRNFSNNVIRGLSNTALSNVLRFLLTRDLTQLVRIESIRFVVRTGIITCRFLLRAITNVLRTRRLSSFLSFSY